MLSVKKMQPKDLDFAVSLANTMGWGMAPEDFEFNMALEPEGCLVLFENEEPLGLVTCISYGAVGWFGNLVVTEQSRGRGAGRQLVQHALNFLKRTGVTTVGIYAYPHLDQFYSRLGFKKAKDLVVLKADAVSDSGMRGSNLQLIKSCDLLRLAEVDGNCFGAPRRKLLEKIFLNPKNVGFVAAEGSETSGFVGAKVFGEAAEVGPLVCKSGQTKTALDLLGAVLSRVHGKEAYLYFPDCESDLLDLALDSGFRKEFRLQTMFFGQTIAKTCIYLAESLERG